MRFRKGGRIPRIYHYYIDEDPAYTPVGSICICLGVGYGYQPTVVSILGQVKWTVATGFGGGIGIVSPINMSRRGER